MSEITKKEIISIIDAELERRRETKGLPNKWKLESLGWMAAIAIGLLTIAGFVFDDWITEKVEKNVATNITNQNTDGFKILRDAILYKLTEKNEFLVDASRKILPDGTTIIVDDKNGCPPPWIAAKKVGGRFIVGVGGQKGLVAKTFRETGGSPTLTLDIEQLPNHRHTLFGKTVTGADDTQPDDKSYAAVTGEGPGNRGSDYNYFIRKSEVSAEPDAGLSGETGKKRHIDHMPPFIALYFCRLGNQHPT